MRLRLRATVTALASRWRLRARAAAVSPQLAISWAASPWRCDRLTTNRGLSCDRSVYSMVGWLSEQGGTCRVRRRSSSPPMVSVASRSNASRTPMERRSAASRGCSVRASSRGSESLSGRSLPSRISSLLSPDSSAA